MGDADAIITAALASAEPTVVDPEKVYTVVLPEGAKHQVIDLGHLLSNPRRKQETVTLFTGESFAEYTLAHLTTGAGNIPPPPNETRLYADEQTASVIAVLNDSGAVPGWGDHRAQLLLRPTPEWSHWMGRHNRLGSQVEFAEHIEDGLADIRDPAAAEMLEIAQHFEASQQVSFRSAHRLQSGVRQLTYEGEVNARAGKQGQIDVPEIFTLALRPYEGADVREVRARLRYRIGNEGRLQIGYVLDRPDLVRIAAFTQILDAVEMQTSLKALRGLPPTR